MSSAYAAIPIGLLAAAGLAAPRPASAWQDPCNDNPAADGTYSYYAPPWTGGNQQCLDVYEPNATALDQTILYLHGGGFTTGDKADSTSVAYCSALADLGYHVVSANYELAVESPLTGNFPAAVEDVKAAVAWIRESTDAAAHGLPDCIIAVGNSAGGALAALLGTTSDVQELAPPAAATYGTAEDFHVDGVVTFAATTDFVWPGCNVYQVEESPGVVLDCAQGIACGVDTSWDPPSGAGCCLVPCVRVPCDSGKVQWCIYLDYDPGLTTAEVFVGREWTASDSRAFFGSPPAKDSSWTGNPFLDASAVHYVDSGDAPYFGFSAELDPLVPANQTGLLVAALQELGSPVTAGSALKEWEDGCGHGIESLFSNFGCQSGGACPAWEPLGTCGNGCSDPERAAYQTLKAIQDELQVSCP